MTPPPEPTNFQKAVEEGQEALQYAKQTHQPCVVTIDIFDELLSAAKQLEALQKENEELIRQLETLSNL